MEMEFLEWLFHRRDARARLPEILVDQGDDAAVVSAAPWRDSDDVDEEGTQSRCTDWVIAADGIADGTHFDWNKHSLEQIGHKALAVNLSDLAAMAAIPKYALVVFQIPQLFELSDVVRLYEGIEATGDRYGCRIVGGDTNRWAGRLAIAVTVIGHPSPGPDGRPRSVPMNGARPGDTIFVTGPLGGSILGRHLTFEPRVELARMLNRRYAIHAMTDLSDSLAADLAAVARASNVGFTLQADRIPVSDDAKTLAKQCPGASSLEHALYDGEDFELVFATDADTAATIQADADLVQSVFPIGAIDSKPGARIVDDEGGCRELEIRGYQH